MVTLISKTAVVVNPATNFSAKVKFNLVVWHMTSTGYIAEFLYSYENADGDDIPINYLSNRKEMSYTAVNTIAATITTPEGLNYVETELYFLTYGSLAIIDAEAPFGLGSGDWDIVT